MSAVVYYSGSVEAAKAVAPEGKVRFCAAKYFHPGEYEAVKIVKKPRVGKQPVLFDKVLLAPGCQNADAIRETYAELGVKVEDLAPPAGKPAKKAAPDVKKPADYGWKMKTAPAKYLEKYPKGAKADLAREVIAKLGG